MSKVTFKLCWHSMWAKRLNHCGIGPVYWYRSIVFTFLTYICLRCCRVVTALLIRWGCYLVIHLHLLCFRDNRPWKKHPFSFELYFHPIVARHACVTFNREMVPTVSKYMLNYVPVYRKRWWPSVLKVMLYADLFSDVST